MTLPVPQQGAHGAHRSDRPRREAALSLWMLLVFAGWTVAYIALSGVVAGWLGLATRGGEVVYIEAWLPWALATLLWVAPLIAGVVLGVLALRQGAGAMAKVGIVVNAVLLLMLTAPALLDRLVNA